MEGLELTNIRQVLVKLASSCSGQGPLDSCPIMQAMEGKKGGLLSVLITPLTGNPGNRQGETACSRQNICSA